MDFISVIIPVFNGDRWIDNTLRTVTEAIDEDCEVIIVNDGSWDMTRDIAMRYVEDDPRFTLIDIKHSGSSCARKAGFKDSQGDYILFVDSDDMLPKDSIKNLRDILDNSIERLEIPDETSLGDETSSMTTSDSGRPLLVIGNTLSRSIEDRLLISGAKRHLSGIEYANDILDGTLPGFLPGVLISREVLEAIEWDENPKITHFDGYYILFSLAMKLDEMYGNEKKITVIPSVVTYNYMRRAGSQSGLMSLTPRGFEYVWNHIDSLNLPEPALTLWGLKLLKDTFVDRGISFPTSYNVAVDLRRRTLRFKDKLSPELAEMTVALGSQKRRARIARTLARTAGLTSIRPHLSCIIVCHRNSVRVEKSVASVFNMGFRNLEVILVDYDNPHNESVALNTINIRYPRVRIIKSTPGMNAYTAGIEGLKAAQGLAVTFVRPGDLGVAKGLYEAVTRIDYGADAVLPNYREYSPMTGLRWRNHSYAYLRSNDESRNATRTAAIANENIYPLLKQMVSQDEETIQQTNIFIYGIVWRTDFLKENIDSLYELVDYPSHTFSHAFVRRLLSKPLRVVTQDKTSSPSFDYVRDNFFRRIILTPFRSRHKASGIPTSY
ncbi:MAG: glycosyltransferase [Muribaculaceae bacterium]|nr:glycosyltransferase [Muribaculaceae bacterium]